MIDTAALAELPRPDRARIRAGLVKLAADIDLDREGPASRFLAGVALALREAAQREAEQYAEWDVFLDNATGALVPDGANPIPDGWQIT